MSHADQVLDYEDHRLRARLAPLLAVIRAETGVRVELHREPGETLRYDVYLDGYSMLRATRLRPGDLEEVFQGLLNTARKARARPAGS
jgi:hypothetical protein